MMTEDQYLDQKIAEKKVYELVKNFVSSNQISCGEAVYQCDWVIENAYEFIEKLCDIVGYYEYD